MDYRRVTVYGDLHRDKPNYVRRMFAAIAHRYDLMNRLMTFGGDEKWRRAVVRTLEPGPDALIIDIATGTGDLARQVALFYPDAQVIGLDFCLEMMVAGRHKFGGELERRVTFVCADALRLPYPDGTFEGATTGFAMRNVASIPHVLAEIYRVLKPGGRMVCLEVSRPTWPVVSHIYWGYFLYVVPLLGWLVSGQAEAYKYLPHSAQAFLPAEVFATEMERAGFRDVQFRRVMLGAAAIHVGKK